MSELAAYNFLAIKNSSSTFSTEEELNAAIENKSADFRCVPNFLYHVYDINKKEVIATVYHARDHFEYLKVANNQVTEFYRKFLASKHVFKTYDLKDTNKELEYYKKIGTKLIKYDTITNEETGFTNETETLPDEYKNKLNGFPHMNLIYYWADKPYGQVIGVATKNL